MLVPGCWRKVWLLLDLRNSRAFRDHQLHRPDIQGERRCSSLSDSRPSPMRNQSPHRNLLHMHPSSFVLMAYVPSNYLDRPTAIRSAHTRRRSDSCLGTCRLAASSSIRYRPHMLDVRNNPSIRYHQIHRPHNQGELRCYGLSYSRPSPVRNQNHYRNLLHIHPISFVLLAYFPSTDLDRPTATRHQLR